MRSISSRFCSKGEDFKNKDLQAIDF